MVTIEFFLKSHLSTSVLLLFVLILLETQPKTKACMQFIWEVTPGNRRDAEMRQKEGKRIKDSLSWTPLKYQCLILRDLLRSLRKCASELSLEGEGNPTPLPSCTWPRAKQSLQVVRSQEAGSERSLNRRQGKVVQSCSKWVAMAAAEEAQQDLK